MRFYIFGDNLGNHKAQKNLDINKKNIINVYEIQNRFLINGDYYRSRIFLGEQYIDIKPYKEGEPAPVSLLLNYLSGIQLQADLNTLQVFRDFIKLFRDLGNVISQIYIGDNSILIKCKQGTNETYLQLNDVNYILSSIGNSSYKCKYGKHDFYVNDNLKFELGNYCNFINLDFFQITLPNGNLLFDNQRLLVNKDVEIYSTDNGIKLKTSNNYFPNAKIIIDTTNLQIPQGAQQNYVLTCVDNNGKAEWRPASSISGTEVYTFQVQARGVSQGNLSHFYIFDYNANNENLRSTTSPYENPQYNYHIPLVAPKNIKLVRAVGCLYHCAVGAGNVNYPVSIPIKVYRNNYDNRTLLGSFNILVPSNVNVGIYNDVSINSFMTFNVDLTDLNINVNTGENFGITFEGQSNSPSVASSIKGCYLTLLAIPV